MEEKTNKAINETLFKRLNTVQKNLCEIELLESTDEHKEPIIVRFFHSAKLRLLELYYNFCENFCDIKTTEKEEMDRDLLYLALAEEHLSDCICP